jgi:hypothetical protein
MICTKCQDDMPDDVCNSLCVNGEYRMVCAVCALEIIRETHGMPAYEFHGPQAQAMYQRAKEFKEREAS